MLDIIDTAFQFLFYGADNGLVVLFSGVCLSVLSLSFVCSLISRGKG